MSIDLRAVSNTKLGMAFGMCIQSRPGTLPVGALGAIAGELTRRGLLKDLLAELGESRSALLSLQIAVDMSRATQDARASARARARDGQVG